LYFLKQLLICLFLSIRLKSALNANKVKNKALGDFIGKKTVEMKIKEAIQVV